eukprot:TRINITY_DN16320_c0_g1_i9.p1 TRINITY_DN16320_c0_g1~~TRINITY_DN16320_c0_g1_i9.p1  ORF type:complete len:570 (-),score=71.40 TRINITY_DN16320_c0_g1_i9:136-1845(-)
MFSRRKSSNRSKPDEDYSECWFKAYPVHSTLQIKRPLFPDPCECSGMKESDFDKISKSLAPENLFQLKLKDFSTYTNWLIYKYFCKTLSWHLESVIFHPGQLEVLDKQLKDKNIFIIEDNIASLLSVIICLLKINRIPTSISIDMKKELCTSNLATLILNNTDFVDFKNQDIIHVGECTILTHNTAMELLSDQPFQDASVVQSVLSWSGEKCARIDFSYPLQLEKFQGDFQRIREHLFFTRQRLRKPNVKDCIGFIQTHKSLFTNPETVDSLHQLRETLQAAGGDLSFTWNSELPLDSPIQSVLQVEISNDSPPKSDPNNCDFGSMSQYYHIESLLAISIVSLIPGPLRLFRGKKGYTLRKSEILEQAETLADIFASKARGQYSCESLIIKLHQGLSEFQSKGIISTVMEQNSSDLSTKKALRLARDLDSDSDSQPDESQDMTKLDLNLTSKTIPLLEDLCQILRKDLVCMNYCLVNLPFLPIRKIDYLDIVKDAIDTNMKKNSKFIQYDDVDFDTCIFSLVSSGILEEEFLRGESWIQAREEFDSELEIQYLLKNLDPFYAVVENTIF